jgi:hypothetical protein
MGGSAGSPLTVGDAAQLPAQAIDPVLGGSQAMLQILMHIAILLSLRPGSPPGQKRQRLRKTQSVRPGFPSNRGDFVIRILFLLPVLP